MEAGAVTEQPSGADAPRDGGATAEESEERVTPLELFFDLVFVFAITQVTSLMSHHPTWVGLGQGLLVLGAVWWAWAAYSWLTNTIDPDEYVARLAMFAAMTGMFVVALAAPEAFDRYGVLFGCAYLAVRSIHIALYAYASPTVGVRGAVKRLAPGVLAGSLLLIVAGTQDGYVQGGLWCLALALDFGAPLVGNMEGWVLQPAHFVERYGLIIIIALGESIVAVGLGLAGVRLHASLIAVAALALLIAGSLWWAYFDIVAIAAERKLKSLRGRAQNKLARDSYSYLHFPMIAGIVLLSLGVKKAISAVHDPLDIVPAVALCGGVALYFAAHIAFRFHNVGSINKQRLLACMACLAVIPLATNGEAIFAVAAIAAVCAILIAYEATRFREARARIRAGGLPESMMREGITNE